MTKYKISLEPGMCGYVNGAQCPWRHGANCELIGRRDPEWNQSILKRFDGCPFGQGRVYVSIDIPE